MRETSGEEHQSPDGMLEKYQRIEARSANTKREKPSKSFMRVLGVLQDEHGKYKFARSRQQEHLSVPSIMQPAKIKMLLRWHMMHRQSQLGKLCWMHEERTGTRKARFDVAV